MGGELTLKHFFGTKAPKGGGKRKGRGVPAPQKKKKKHMGEKTSTPEKWGEVRDFCLEVGGTQKTIGGGGGPESILGKKTKKSRTTDKTYPS